MKLLTKPYFLLFTFSYLTVKYLQYQNIALPSFIQHHLNDLLCLPIILTLGLFLVRKIKRDAQLELSIWHILGMCIFYALYFEYYLPQKSIMYTADPVDALMYFIGGVIFYVLRKWELRKGLLSS